MREDYAAERLRRNPDAFLQPSMLTAAIYGLCLSMLGTVACAHDIWLTTASDGTRVRAQVNFGDTDDRQMADLPRIVSLEVVTARGIQDLRKGLSAAPRSNEPVLVTRPFVAPHGSVLAISYDNGFWVRIPGQSQEINTSTLMVPKGVDSRWTVKYGKTLLGPGSFRRVLHSRMELVALQDPFKLPRGQKLPVRLEVDGRPLAGARVAYGDGVHPIPDARMPTAVTGSDGIALIPLTRIGPYLITADSLVPPVAPALVRQDHLYASLAFDLSR